MPRAAATNPAQDDGGEGEAAELVLMSRVSAERGWNALDRRCAPVGLRRALARRLGPLRGTRRNAALRKVIVRGAICRVVV